MKIYVESNFVLELALQQEQASSCEEILELCEGVDRELVVPAYSLAEPYETLIRRRKERERIQRDLYVELQQLARSATYSGRLDAFDAVSTLLIGTAEQDAARLEEVRSQIMGRCTIIPLGRSVLAEAARYQRVHDFGPQDAIVYASVVSHLVGIPADERACFLNRNFKDFEDQRVVEELEGYRCKLLPSFDAGFGYIRGNPS